MSGHQGIHLPELWREEPLCYYYPHHRHGDLYSGQGGTEFGWGAGLIAPMYNEAPPGPGASPGAAAARVGGGQYMPEAPRVVPPCSTDCESLTSASATTPRPVALRNETAP